MLPMQWYSSASGRAGYGFMNNFQMRVVNERLEIRARVPFRLLSDSVEVHRRSYIGFPTERLEDLQLQRGHQDPDIIIMKEPIPLAARLHSAYHIIRTCPIAPDAREQSQ